MSRRRVLRGLLVPWLLMSGACGDTSTADEHTPPLPWMVDVDRAANLPDRCGTPDGLTVRFVMRDQWDRSIGPSVQLATGARGLMVRTRDTFDVDDVSVVDNRAVMYPTPAVGCASNDDCLGAGLAGATCRELIDGWRECGFEAALSVDAGVPLQWKGRAADDDEPSPIDALILVPSGSMQLGVLPSGQVDPTFSTDPERDLVLAAAQLVRRLADARTPGPRRVSIGVYPGADGAPFVVDAGGMSWFEAESSNALYDAQSELFAGAARPGALPADPPSSLLAALADPGWQADPGGRHVVLMVDAMGALETGFDVALLERALAEAGAVLHVVQLDNEVACPASGPHAVGPCTPCEGADCQSPLLVARSGVSTELAELACVTGGSFAYADNPEELVASAAPIAGAVSEHWIAALTLEPAVDLPAGAYATSFELAVTLLDSVGTVRFDLERRPSMADTRQLVWIDE